MQRTHLRLLVGGASAAVLAACTSQPREAETAQGPADGEQVTVTGSLIADAVEAPRDPSAPPAPPPPSPSVMGRMMAGNVAQAYLSAPQQMPQPRPGDVDRERYENVKINSVKLVQEEPVSTFSIDVDTASYANVRRFLNRGTMPPKDAVRIEELVNYFDYDYALPKSKDTPFETTVKVVPSPWGKGRQLMHVGIQGYDIARTERPPLNLTLLLDVSGSMSDENKLPLAIKALKLLLDEMDEKDTISIAVYAGAAGTVLEPTKGSEKGRIIAALEKLSAGGSTAGGEGLRLAYTLAKQNFHKDSVNRVILMTDGDFNVGINDPERLKDFVEREREAGVYLSVIGFGQDNYNDAMMQKLAQNGNGIAAYIDTLNEARKVFNDDLSGSMFSIANDVKIQVEFNPSKIAEYRLIGYETRLLNREDFNNDKVDAGEIGAGHSVTAIYELTPVGSPARLVEASRYAAAPAPKTEAGASEFAFLKLRYKIPGQDASKLIERPVTAADQIADLSKAPEATRFAAAVAGYGQLLRGDPFMDNTFTWDSVVELAQNSKGKDEFGYRAEFIQLARIAKTAASQEALRPPAGVGQ